MKRLVYLFAILILVVSGAQAQKIDVKPVSEDNVEGLIKSFLGEGIVLKSYQTHIFRNGTSLGTFSDKSVSTGIESGIVMSTGSVKYIDKFNPTNSVAPDGLMNLDSTEDREIKSLAWNQGDNDLESLLGKGNKTYDVCSIEMEVIPMADTLEFNYVFASQEYDEYVGSKFNDIFAIYVSGKGIGQKRNLATLPNSRIPISINNVNSGNPQANIPATNGSFHIRNLGEINLNYDGFTRLMSIKQKVVPYEVYRIKIVIADVGDGALDSGVLLENKSMISYSNSFSVPFDDNDYSIMEDSEMILERVCELKEKKNIKKILLIGHTDSRGSEEYNTLLAERRVNEVKNYLISKGMHENQLIVVSKGEFNPVSENETFKGQKINRRVEIKFLGDNESYVASTLRELEGNKEKPLLEKCFPNPADEFVKFKYFIPNSFTKASIQIYQATGQAVTSVDIAFPGKGETQFETANLSEGAYFATLVVDGEKITTNKIVVQH